MNVYRVEKVNMTNVVTTDDYAKALESAEVKYCIGLNQVFDFCGGKLFRCRNGYAGNDGKYGYVAFKVNSIY